MPEQYIDNFTTADGIPTSAVWHIQRLSGNKWLDRQVKNADMFGLDVASARVTFNIQDLVGGAQSFAISPGAGNIYVNLKSYAVYTPGSIMDNADVEVLGHISFESGGVNGASSRFTFNGNVQGSSLRGSTTNNMLITTAAGFNFFITDPTTANGTITVFSLFAIVAV